VAVVALARLLAGICRLAVRLATRGRPWRACFRAATLCTAVALCIGMLVTAPAQAAPVGTALAGLPASALPAPITDPGGDFVVTMPYSGVSQATATQLVSTTVPQELGLSASPTLSSEMTAAYQATTGPLAAAGVTTGAPSSFSGGSVSVSSTAVTVDVPAAALPPDSASNPAGPAAETAAQGVNFATILVTFLACAAFSATVFGVSSPGQLSQNQNIYCTAIAVAAGAANTAALIDTWFGTQIASTLWAQILVNVLATGLIGGAAVAWATPWVVQLGTSLGPKIQSAATSAWTSLQPWIPSWSTVVSAFGKIAGLMGSVAAAVWNPLAGALGLPTVQATGAIEDRSLGDQAECMDAYGAQQYSYEGEPAAINACNGTQEQNWTQWSNGRGSMLTNGGLCLDITGSSWQPGVPLELYECNGQWNQSWWEQWTAFGTPQIVNPTNGYCVDDPDWNTAPGTQLQQDWCRLTTAQRWSLPGDTSGTGTFPSVTAYGPVDSGLSGECMDAYGSSNGASPGQSVAINNCNGNPAQDWTVWSDGTIRVWNMCMDTTGDSAGALVELEDCDGAASQDWVPQSNGSLENKASGLCLSDFGVTTPPGISLDMDTCDGTPDEQQWTLPGPPPGQTAPPAPSNASVCDIYASYGTPCAAAYSMDRALYSAYDGPLYQVQRASDGTTENIGLLVAGGDVNASEQNSFCANTTCTITEIYDQSPDGNNLTIEQGGGAAPAADQGAVADALPITIGGNEAYGLDIEPRTGYRDDTTTGVATGSEPEGMYMVASGTHVNASCCFDFGNAETNNHDNGAGHMDAVNLGLWCGQNSQPCTGSGPWVEDDMENGQWMGNGSNPGDTGNATPFVTAMVNDNGTSDLEIEGGDSTSGGLTTFYNGALPSGYSPMQKEGAIVLGTGGDNSNGDVGSWFEGVMTQGFPSAAANAAVQANIVAAGYAGDTNPGSSTPASAAGQAVVHAAGATGAAASGYSSVYTVDSANGDLQETYLPAMGDNWTTQDLSAKYGTPQVMPGTEPVAVVHCGWTSVYTVDASSGDLQETYLPAIGDAWTTQDLSAKYGTPPTNVTPTAVEHTAGAAGASDGCGYTSVYTRDRNGDLQETYLPDTGFPGDPWITQDLSANYGAPAVLSGTSPVAIVHCGWTSVYTIDATDHHLQETYLPAIGDSWTSQDLSAKYGTPLTTTTPTAVVHTAGASGATDGCGYTSVYTVDQGSQDLQETYLPDTGFPGDPWVTQNLSANYGTPPVAPGTQPEALVHMNYTSVYTVDQGSDDLQETYLPAIGDPWTTQDLSAKYGTPTTDQTPIVLLHPDASGNLDWVSVYTIDELSDDLQETYLPNTGFPGDSWVTQDLSAKYGTPAVDVLQSSQSSWSVDHSGYTSAYTVDAASGDLQETYLPAMGDSWSTQDLSAKYGTPAVAPGTDPQALVHDGFTSVYTVDNSNGDLQETFLPALGDSWTTQDLSAKYGAPPVMAGTSPTAVFHDGYTSVYTVDASSGDLQETYVPVLGGPWTAQDLSAKYGTPTTGTTPAVVVHDGYTSVYTVDASSGDLQETYLPAIGDPWTTQNLSANYGVPAALQGSAPVALYHTGYTSVYFLAAASDDLEEAYLPAISDPWHSQDLTANYGVPDPDPGQALSPLVHYAANGGRTWTSIYTVDWSNYDLQETYLPAIDDSWTTQDLSAKYGTPTSQP
jgi:hypothetical protein